MFLGPYNNDWTGFSQEAFDYIVFDGFKGQLTIQQLELLCEQEGSINTKGGTIRWDRPLVIIVVSNFDFTGCFDKVSEKDPFAVSPLSVRFNRAYMNKQFELEFE